MPDNCKALFLESMNPLTRTTVLDPQAREILSTEFSPEELTFLETTRTISDFRIGLEIPGKLIPTHIRGGVLLSPTMYTLRKDARLI